ncbi:MAG: LicD family protein [Rikenellaceae bacterium]
MEYKEGELEQLHIHLYDILSHTVEVCERLNINYTLIGGSAVGALFDGAILPWDDDIDLGMERSEYNRFIAEAPAALGRDYVLQSPECDCVTPYYFAKVRKRGTRFEGEDEFGLEMNHGIYIDIFPLDRVPDNKFAEKIHRWCVRMLHNSFVATTIPLKEGGEVAKAIVNMVARVVGKRRLYRWLVRVQSHYNSCDTKYVSIVKMPRDHIERSTLNPPDVVEFGGMRVNAPHKLREYLEWHYPNLHRDVKPEEQINHAPIRLNFNGDE